MNSKELEYSKIVIENEVLKINISYEAIVDFNINTKELENKGFKKDLYTLDYVLKIPLNA